MDNETFELFIYALSCVGWVCSYYACNHFAAKCEELEEELEIVKKELEKKNYFIRDLKERPLK